ncbi:hypothetical protein B0A55_03803 [Friedmanniomyces simplex]|uniref:Uncharacterized protein n=1 Tax=Friedmanniomyces simplex TaxID=329884 RepID=A0A4U0XQJ2_9PEZI|nr:hypothetical protein B0A55_03803 [Friedmanniomyces simplex]
MKSIMAVLALAAMFGAGVLAAVIPTCDETDIVQAKSLIETPTLQFQQVMGNLSYLFGWTLAGSAVDTDELDLGCSDISNLGHGKWAAQGLNPAYIQEPVCNQSHGNPNATLALPWELYYSTEIFVTQMLNAFAPNNTAAFTYLCENLRFLSLDGFHLSDSRVINASCTKAGTLQPPRPFTAAPGVELNTNATVAYRNTISTLYGLMYASSALSNTELNIYCAHEPNYVRSLNTLLLNGTLVEETICNITQPLSVDSSIAALRTWSSKAFITVIENISNVSGWLAWLSNNLDVDAMNSVGLDGATVLAQVTQDAASS